MSGQVGFSSEFGSKRMKGGIEARIGAPWLRERIMPTVRYYTRNQSESSVICDGCSSKAVLHCTVLVQHRDVGSGARSARRKVTTDSREDHDRSNLLSVVRAVSIVSCSIFLATNARVSSFDVLRLTRVRSLPCFIVS